jgi:hypothetical protein
MINRFVFNNMCTAACHGFILQKSEVSVCQQVIDALARVLQLRRLFIQNFIMNFELSHKFLQELPMKIVTNSVINKSFFMLWLVAGLVSEHNIVIPPPLNLR